MSPAHRVPGRMDRRAVLAGAAAGVVTAIGAAGVVRLLIGRSPSATGPTGTPSTVTGSAPTKQTTQATPSVTRVPVVELGGGPVPGISGKAMLGAYLELSDMSFAAALRLRKQQLGRNYRIIHVFYDWTDNLPTTIAGAPAGSIPMISWRGTSHDEILGGDHDSMIAANARRLAKDGKPKFLRWGWEMNGDWYAWSGPKNDDNPAGYVACWKHIRKIFDKEGADNVSWVWSVNWNSRPDTTENGYQAYYPGDKYVDWVAISGYNLHHEKPATLFDNLYSQYAARKPMMISETGSVDWGGETKGEWVTDFAAYVEGRPNIAAVCWFDTDTHRNYTEQWRIDSVPTALSAFRAMARNARFSA